MTESALLDSRQMARFVARGFLRFDAAVPDDVNRQFLDEAGRAPEATGEKLMKAYRRLLAENEIPAIAPGVPLADAYPPTSAIARLLALPVVAGAVRSLVGPDPIFDHHFLHVTFPPEFYARSGQANVSQHTHQDSTIDTRRAFDIQIMYFPHAVTADMGGTRYVPGSHLRIVSEAAIGRYQNIRGQEHVVCPAGTLLFLHHGIWHGGGVNRSSRLRYMFKIRINPSVPQVQLWDTRDLDRDETQAPIFFVKAAREPESIHALLMRLEPWYEADTGRLELINRIRLWRRLLGDSAFDVDYWLTRLENDPRDR